MNSARVQFGKYSLCERLGAGGMAEVFRAVLEGPCRFSRSLVIKRVLPELACDFRFVSMLAREARLSALLRHPNIVQVHEFGVIDGEFYMAMELVEGLNLQQLVLQASTARRDLPVGVVCFIVCEVARALAYAHGLSEADGPPLELVHRDVTPTNIMVTPLGSVKLLDFGIAKATHQTNAAETRRGMLRGKVGYVSPEQVNGAPPTAHCDLYALGIVFHELLTGRRLFHGGADLQILARIAGGDIEPPSVSREGIPSDVDALVMRMLARRPEERLGSAHDVAAALLPIRRRLDGDGESLQQLLSELAEARRRKWDDEQTLPDVAPADFRS
jgi:eukaryotic-like serine/threonine-protein kinase